MIVFVITYMIIGFFFAFGFYRSAEFNSFSNCVIVGAFWPLIIIMTIILAIGLWCGNIDNEINFGFDDDDHLGV